MLMCEGCRTREATYRVNFPGTPAHAHTYSICFDCRSRLYGLDEERVLVVRIDWDTETPPWAGSPVPGDRQEMK